MGRIQGRRAHGCLIYDNGWAGTDRGHGHAIYTQNEDGIKTIADCIMTGGHGYTLHAYGSARAYVDNYLVAGNIAYAADTFLIGGGRPSHNIRVRDNVLHGVAHAARLRGTAERGLRGARQRHRRRRA